MTYQVRRISFAAMSDGTLGIGVTIRFPEPSRLYAGMLPANDMHVMLSQARKALDELTPEEVIVSFPNFQRPHSTMTNAAVVSILNSYRCDVSRVITADEVQSIEHICGSRYAHHSGEHYTVETVRRLNLAYLETQRRDVAFGQAWSLASSAVVERMKLVVEQNAYLKQQVQDRELALAQYASQHLTSLN